MKILHTVEFYHPSVGGVQEVVRQLSERLVRLGHKVTVATTRLPERKNNVVNGVQIEEFAISGKLVTGMTGDVERYRQFLLESDFDVITNFAAQQWATDAALPILDEIKAAKVFVPTGFSGFYLPQYREYFSSMRYWLHKYGMNVFLSDDYRDINFARDCGVRNITVIPNGADEDEFLPESGIDIRGAFGIPVDCFLILHVGSHTGIKGHAEAIRIFNKARIRNATFMIIANDFGGGCGFSCRLKEMFYRRWHRWQPVGKRLIVTSLSRTETIAAYKTADLFLFPSNIECSPIVLFECMASKTPFLTTDVGNAAEIIRWSHGGVLLPTVHDTKGYASAELDGSSRMLGEIYGDLDKRRQMAEEGFNSWQQRFTWKHITNMYESLYRSLAEERGKHAINH